MFTIPCANSIITESLLQVLRWKHQSTESLMKFLFREAAYKPFCSYKSAAKQSWRQKQTLRNMTTSICVFFCLICVFLLFYFVLFFFPLFTTGSIVYVGMMVGAFFWGGMADKVGRRQCLLICMSMNGFFAFLSSFVQGYGVFLLCRTMSGFGWVCFPHLQH